MENLGPIIEMGLTFQFCGIPVNISFWTSILAAFLLWDSRRYLMDILPGSRFHYYWLAAICACLAMILSLALHEMNHAIVAYALSDGISEAGMTWWGAYVRPVKSLLEVSPGITIAISMVGPLTNIVISFLLLILVRIFNESLPENTFQYIGIMNFKIGILNLLPIIVTDGGKMLFGLFHLAFDSNTSLIIVSVISFISIAYLIFRPDHHFRPSEWFVDIVED